MMQIRSVTVPRTGPLNGMNMIEYVLVFLAVVGFVLATMP